MTTITQPLRDEHQELYPHIEGLRVAADAVGQTAFETMRQSVDDAYEFLAHHLLPHAQAEERALYPVVADLLGRPESTGTMRRDHVEIGRLAEELGQLRASLTGASLSDAQARALRRVLYGLYALVRVHFAKEEEVFLPLLDQHLSADEAQRMFAAMEAAAGEAKAAIH